jgi:hypothetical protein
MSSVEKRIRSLSNRAEFFLVITLSFAYYIGTSLAATLLRIRQLELTTGRALRAIATEIAILLVVAWILRIRGWTASRINGRFTFPERHTVFSQSIAHWASDGRSCNLRR